MVEHPFAAVLAAGAAALDEPVAARLADDLGAPLRVVVCGRSGSGRDTVRRALRGAGAVVADPDEFADVAVYVFAETLTPEDRAALAAGRRPSVAVLNKADLSCFRGNGPMAAAAERCSELERRTGVPTRPLAALLAVAAAQPAVLDQSLLDALRVVTIEPARLTPEIGRRLLAELDLFGIATAVAAVGRGADRAALVSLLREVSGVQAVLAAIDRAGAPIRYRRLIQALAQLAELAVGPGGAGVAQFLAADAVVLARMAAAVDVIAAPETAAGPTGGRSAQLRRAIHWQRYARGPVSGLHRACGIDIARGALRLWVQAGGIPVAMP